MWSPCCSHKRAHAFVLPCVRACAVRRLNEFYETLYEHYVLVYNIEEQCGDFKKFYIYHCDQKVR